MAAQNGLNVDEGGRLAAEGVTVPYVLAGTDVYINGTLCQNDGTMIVTEDASLGAGDVFINGIRHTSNGVRYVDQAVKANSWPEGFTVGDDGRQGVFEGNGTFLLRGIGRLADGRMSIAIAG